MPPALNSCPKCKKLLNLVPDQCLIQDGLPLAHIWLPVALPTVPRPVWPAVEIKSSPIFANVAKNQSWQILLDIGVFNSRHKQLPNIWATFVTQFVARTFQKTALSVTLATTNIFCTLAAKQKSWKDSVWPDCFNSFHYLSIYKICQSR